MKALLTIIVEKLDGDWWRMRWSKGDPPEEREGHYILVALLRMIKAKLDQVETEDEKHS